MITNYKFLLFSTISFFLSSCITKSTITPVHLHEETITYQVDSLQMKSYIVYNDQVTTKRPAVLVAPEWWGLNDYAKSRARQLAALGYIAIAVDMYGNSKIAANPSEASAAAGPFYQNPAMAKKHVDAAIAQIKLHPNTDPSNIAAIGYCFGGGVLLNIARMGEDLKGVVSFHGSLLGTPFNKDLLKTKILVLHGAADQFVSDADVATFKQQMDSIGATYTFKSYAGATHAFTNPDATATGKKFNLPIAYNATADTASWNEMKQFLNQVFK